MVVEDTRADTMAEAATQAVIITAPVPDIIPVITAAGVTGIIPVVMGGATGATPILTGGGLIRMSIHIPTTILITTPMIILILIMIPISMVINGVKKTFDERIGEIVSIDSL